MKDETVLAQKAAMIERCVARAQAEHAAAHDFATDFTRQDAAVLNVERACEACISLAALVVSRLGLGLPTFRRQAFAILAAEGLIPADLADRLGAMVGFRNVAVHAYAELDLKIVEAVITTRLDDLVRFARLMLAAEGKR